MRLRIAAPEGPLYAPLLSSPAPREVVLIRTSEHHCAQLLATSQVEVAFLSPLAYGQASQTTEYRIIPASALALEGYTERVWLAFRPGLRTLRRCIVPAEAHFLPQALRLLLLELYDLEPELLPRAVTQEVDALHDADAVLSWNETHTDFPRLDVGEEWYTAFEYPLLLGFWVCRGEELPSTLPHLLLSLARSALPAIESVREASPIPPLPPRHGRIHWRWNQILADALQQTLTLLYYHGLVPHIREVTLWDASSP
ncbi:Chorismate dehydratase [bacterium HR21]|nr:Chorismate dehydratase [bacterium HR21]